MSSLKDRVKSLQADTTNTDTALTTLEEALAEKVSLKGINPLNPKSLRLIICVNPNFSSKALNCT